MFRQLLAFGGVLVLTGGLVLVAAEPGLARGPGGGVFQRGGGFGGSAGAGMRGSSFAGPRFNPSSIYAPPGYNAYQLYPYYSYNYNYGLYPYYNRRSTSYYNSSGYGEFPYSSEATESYPYPEGTPAYGQGYPPGGAAASQVPAERHAHISVNVPAGAEVWFDDHKTSSTGPVRDFQTPPLEPGKYGYKVRARWQEDGHEVTQSREVVVSPGADVQVSFPLPRAGQGEAGSAKER